MPGSPTSPPSNLTAAKRDEHGGVPQRRLAVSPQRSHFGVQAFIYVIERVPRDAKSGRNPQECPTRWVIDDAHTLCSDAGALYLNDYNRRVPTPTSRSRHRSRHAHATSPTPTNRLLAVTSSSPPN